MSLPTEIWESILGYITCPSDLVYTLSVCRLWYSIAHQLLYKNIVLESFQHVDRFIQCLDLSCQRPEPSGYTVNSLQINDSLKDQQLIQLSVLCPRLTRLDVAKPDEALWLTLAGSQVVRRWGNRLTHLPRPYGRTGYIPYTLCLLRYRQLYEITLPDNYEISPYIKELIFDFLKDFSQLQIVRVRYHLFPIGGVDFPRLIKASPEISHLKILVELVCHEADYDTPQDMSDDDNDLMNSDSSGYRSPFDDYDRYTSDQERTAPGPYYEEEEEEEEEEEYEEEHEDEYSYGSNYCYNCGSYHYTHSSNPQTEEEEEEVYDDEGDERGWYSSEQDAPSVPDEQSIHKYSDYDSQEEEYVEDISEYELDQANESIDNDNHDSDRYDSEEFSQHAHSISYESSTYVSPEDSVSVGSNEEYESEPVYDDVVVESEIGSYDEYNDLELNDPYTSDPYISHEYDYSEQEDVQSDFYY
ncbi:hypothetical protein RMCBS344292_08820 [Rhizopus microsporus]|nr:hypothetical protein RMCBS344292_08820 [Rhizopus microsporus]